MPFPHRFAALVATALPLLVHAGAGAPGHHHAAASFGEPGQASQVSRSVTVDMNDAMRFSPASLQAKTGETIKLIIKNSGQLKHELVLGPEKELKAHYELMKQHPEMEHDEPNMVSLLPGQTGEIIWRFTHAGRVDFACLQPGHYEAGMKGAVTVAGRTVASKAPAHPHEHAHEH
jgi:uncharacterized cupredoxin-like copper-binding protein